MEELEVKRNAQINEAIRNYKKDGISDASCNLFREDVEYGVPMEQADRYMTQALSIEQQRIISKAIRGRYPEELIAQMLEGDLNPFQMKEMLGAYETGIEVSNILEVVEEGKNAFGMNEAFADLKSALEQAQEEVTKQELPSEVTEMLNRLESQITDIGIQTEKYDALMKKLNEINSSVNQDEALHLLQKQLEDKDQQIRELKDDIEAKKQELSHLQSQTKEQEQTLSDQQDKLNQANQKISSLETENDILNRQLEKSQMEKAQVTEPEQEKEKSMENKKDTMPVHFQTMVVGSDGSSVPVLIERQDKRKQRGLLAMAEKMMPTKPGKKLVKQMAGNKLNREQMEQIKNAILSGLNSEEVADIIESGFSAKEMAEAIAVVVADKTYN